MKIPSILWMNILNFKEKVKFIYICSKLIFESLARKVDIHKRFFFLKLLKCILDLFVYIMELQECTNLYLLCSDVVNYFFVQ